MNEPMNEPMKTQKQSDPGSHYAIDDRHGETPQVQHTPFSLPLSVDEIPSGLELVDAEGRLVASREFTGKNDQAKREVIAFIALSASNHARLTAQNAALVEALKLLTNQAANIIQSVRKIHPIDRAADMAVEKAREVLKAAAKS